MNVLALAPAAAISLTLVACGESDEHLTKPGFTPIAFNREGDQGAYKILNAEIDSEGFVQTVSKRVGPSGVSYRLAIYDCQRRLVGTLATGETAASLRNLRPDPNMAVMVTGSSATMTGTWLVRRSREGETSQAHVNILSGATVDSCLPAAFVRTARAQRGAFSCWKQAFAVA